MQDHHIKADSGELMELTHEPVPGYRKALIIIITAALLYLAVIFIW